MIEININKSANLSTRCSAKTMLEKFRKIHMKTPVSEALF